MFSNSFPLCSGSYSRKYGILNGYVQRYICMIYNQNISYKLYFYSMYDIQLKYGLYQTGILLRYYICMLQLKYVLYIPYIPRICMDYNQDTLTGYVNTYFLPQIQRDRKEPRYFLKQDILKCFGSGNFQSRKVYPGQVVCFFFLTFIFLINENFLGVYTHINIYVYIQLQLLQQCKFVNGYGICIKITGQGCRCFGLKGVGWDWILNVNKRTN
eukprot:TRINITY_DN3336_c0_g1_i11.p5 TRINITY_DN3336_c0_g1~~TRINITY_DN3336_c0_g1_i11.p5  ORF type:complete len:213 (-),score=-3.92 TRINITY_DN3336_c0_g1_i11:268-906(-)